MGQNTHENGLKKTLHDSSAVKTVKWSKMVSNEREFTPMVDIFMNLKKSFLKFFYGIFEFFGPQNFPASERDPQGPKIFLASERGYDVFAKVLSKYFLERLNNRKYTLRVRK